MAGLAEYLEVLENAIPASLTKFDAFPKLPKAYKARSESRGFMTVFILLAAVLLMLNDLGEYIWGWPDFEFGVDDNRASYLPINVDLTVNMPCKYLTVDLRDAMGDRLFLSGGFRRDGTTFDAGQATAMKEHATALSAQQAQSQSRKGRGFFSKMFSKKQGGFKPTYNHVEDGSACRIWGTQLVKRVTANLHITTLGHGYASYEHVDHDAMNLTHVIQEFSFGQFFPEIVQPLDNSFEVTDEHFVAYQYFLHVVPTTYVAPRSQPLRTHQYSVTHYTRTLEHDRGTPGIFFKFELDPLHITQYQRTTTFFHLLMRCIGVLGGIFVCTNYALRVGAKAVAVVSGKDQEPGFAAAEASGVKLRSKWGGADLRARQTRNSGGWTPASPYTGGFTPATPGTAYTVPSPYLSSNLHAGAAGSAPGTPSPGYAPRTPSYTYPASPYAPQSPAPDVASVPSTPGYQYAPYPASPNPAGNGNGLHAPPPSRAPVAAKKDD